MKTFLLALVILVSGAAQAGKITGSDSFQSSYRSYIDVSKTATGNFLYQFCESIDNSRYSCRPLTDFAGTSSAKVAFTFTKKAALAVGSGVAHLVAVPLAFVGGLEISSLVVAAANIIPAVDTGVGVASYLASAGMLASGGYAAKVTNAKLAAAKSINIVRRADIAAIFSADVTKKEALYAFPDDSMNELVATITSELAQ